MSLATELQDIIQQYGLEYFNLYLGQYRGEVISNEDPEFLGRLKIRVPVVHGDETPDYWSPSIGIPVTEAVLWMLPKKGDTVWVTFEQGNPDYPIWNYGPATNKVPESARKKDNYVLQTFKGQRIELNDDNETVTITNKAGFVIQMSKEGIDLGKGNETLGKALDDLISQIKLIVVNTAVGPSAPSGPVNNLAFDLIGKRLKTILQNALS